MKKWLIIVQGDVEPSLHGPFETKKARDTYAMTYRLGDLEMRDGIYKLTTTRDVPTVDTY